MPVKHYFRNMFLLMAFLLTMVTGNAFAGEEAPLLSVSILDVGQGLCVAACSDDEWILYDGGGAQSAAGVVSWLKAQGAGRLSEVIVSHYDDDHVCGVISALYAFDAGEVLLPGYESDTVPARMLEDALSRTGIPFLTPDAGMSRSFGKASFTVVGPEDYLAEKENDRSIAIRITCGDISVLITGDAQETEEEAMCSSGRELGSVALIAGHHGGNSSTTGKFLNKVSCWAAVISSGPDNRFDHPGAKALERLQSFGCHLYRTDLQGSICLYTDGQYLYSDPVYCDDFTPGPLPRADGAHRLPAPEDVRWRYMLNTYSGKFHRPDCEAALKTGVRNRAWTDREKGELMEMGYSPCRICCP